jgi:hypothetical protein
MSGLCPQCAPEAVAAGRKTRNVLNLAVFPGAPGRIRTSDPQIRSLCSKKMTTGRRLIDIKGTALGSRPVIHCRRLPNGRTR